MRIVALLGATLGGTPAEARRTNANKPPAACRLGGAVAARLNRERRPSPRRRTRRITQAKLGHGALRSRGIIQHLRVERPTDLAFDHTGLGDHLTTPSKTRSGRSLECSLLRHNVNTVELNASSPTRSRQPPSSADRRYTPAPPSSCRRSSSGDIDRSQRRRRHGRRSRFAPAHRRRDVGAGGGGRRRGARRRLDPSRGPVGLATGRTRDRRRWPAVEASLDAAARWRAWTLEPLGIRLQPVGIDLDQLDDLEESSTRRWVRCARSTWWTKPSMDSRAVNFGCVGDRCRGPLLRRPQRPNGHRRRAVPRRCCSPNGRQTVADAYVDPAVVGDGPASRRRRGRRPGLSVPPTSNGRRRSSW